MNDIISRKEALDEVDIAIDCFWHHEVIRKAYKYLMRNIKALPAVDAVVLPCKIGDKVWCIRGIGNKLYVKDGIVGEVFFNSNMELVISVKHILKGKWGQDVFASKAEAEAAARDTTNESGGILKRDTICWDCKKAGGLCSWSSNHTPVEGWEAKETWIKFPEKVVPSYCVLRCPEFEEG